MLSISTIKSAGSARLYFEKDNYYLKDIPGDTPDSLWFGKTAKALKLDAELKPAEFQNIMEGYLPNGERLGVARDGKWQHRPGWDLTFSAPKSVSIAALMGKDKRLVEAHHKAVQTVLVLIEKDCAQARVFNKGQIEYEDTGNLLAALFTHTVSRELDPALHTHSTVLNVTQRADGKFRSMASKAGIQSEQVDGFGERVWQRMKYYGMYYRAELAHSAEKMGYTVEQRTDVESFELKGVPEKVIRVFSKRHEQIATKQKELGRFDAKTNEYVTLMTRAKKEAVDKDTLMQTWQAESVAHHFDALDFVSKNKAHTNSEPIAPQESNRLAKEAVEYAYNHLAEREAVFPQDALASTAMMHTIGKISPSAIEKAIASAAKQGVLVERSLVFQGQHCPGWTTKSAIALEKELIDELHISKCRHQTAATVGAVQRFLQDKGFTPGQLEACQLILTAKEPVIGVQGFAGTGKTTLLNAVREFYQQQPGKPITIRGVAAQGSAANQLQEGAGITSQTLYSFLTQQAEVKGRSQFDTSLQYSFEKTEYHNNLVIVDEASMVSTRDMLMLLKYANQRHFKVVLLGDEAQLGAIEAGKPFSVLQQQGMTTAMMKDIVRQSNPDLKRAIYHAIDHQVIESFNKLDKSVYEIPKDEERIAALVQSYFSLSKAERNNTLVLTASNKDREILNEALRAGLVEQGELESKSVQIATLHNRGLTRPEQKRVSNYQLGDQVRFNKDYTSLKLKRGQYYEVVAINQASNQLQLQTTQGERIDWDPAQVAGGRLGAIEVYETKARQIAKNEQIRWTRNNKHQQQTNAERAVVLKVKENAITVRLQSGRRLTFDPRELKSQHFEYAYANTAHYAQGQTCQRVMALYSTQNKNLTNLRSFYVVISRAREQALLYTNDKQGLMEWLPQNSGEKTSALEGQTQPLAAKGSTLMQTGVEASSAPLRSEKGHGKAPKWDVAQVLNQLVNHTETITEKLLGPPNPRLSTSKELRFGNKGSLAVSLSGSKRGLWVSHEEGCGGNLLQLIQRENLCRFEQALEQAAGYLQLSPERQISGEKQPHAPKPVKALGQHNITSEDKKKMAYAKHLYQKSKPIGNTIAANYLCKHRGITLEPNGNLRYLPAMKDFESGITYPALLAAARNIKGDIQAVQVTYLNPVTQHKADLDVNKRTFGRMKWGASVTLQEGAKENPVLIAEGIETGLSLAEAFPQYTVKASLSESNFAKVVATLPKEQTVILCADNDGASIKVNQAIGKVVAQSTAQDRTIFVTHPNTIKTDFNDLHQTKGIKVIQKIVNKDINRLNKHYRVLPINLGKEYCSASLEKSKLSGEKLLHDSEKMNSVEPTSSFEKMLRLPIYKKEIADHGQLER